MHRSKPGVQKPSVRLTEIDVVRAFVVVALVATHAFAPYTKAWTLPASVAESGYFPFVGSLVYNFIGRFVYNGMLETFTCISGYVFAFQVAVRREGKLQPFGSLVADKLRRLMVPCVVWGAVYILLLNPADIPHDATLPLSIVGGVGHLWYLPMLFWCFCAARFLLEYPMRRTLLVLAVLAWLPVAQLPLRLHSVLYYLFFFCMGCALFDRREQLARLSRNGGVVLGLFLACLFLLAVNIVGGKWMAGQTAPDGTALCPLIADSCKRALRFAGAMPVVVLYFLTGFRLRESRLMPVWRIIAKHSFGIYLLQEIFLKMLYYKTTLPALLGAWLPWAGLIVAFFLSLLVSFLLQRNRLTRRMV